MDNTKPSRVRSAGRYSRHIFRWVLLALLVGTLSGLLGALFYHGIAAVTALREGYPGILFTLPALGMFIVFLYRLLGQEGSGTDTVIDAAEAGAHLTGFLLPSIFIGTILTHLGGGSAGREGAALQIGGEIGNGAGRLLKLDKQDMKIATMTGMAAFFSAIFGTPLTATVFVTMFMTIGTFYEAALLPCSISALTAIGIARRLGVVPFGFAVTAPDAELTMMLRVCVLAVLAGLLSVVFVEVLHKFGELFKRLFPNPYVRAAAGGAMVVVLTLILKQDFLYNGAGGGLIARAITQGRVPAAAFLLKILFTALTLESGFKGGEIVPTFCIGACFGCIVGPLMGIPAPFAAAVGLIAMFAGATNTVLASVFLALEAFGGAGILYFFMAALVSYLVSGYNGLYSSQTFVFSKVRTARINAPANGRYLYAGHLKKKDEEK